MKLRVNWGHASAHQLKRASVDTDGGNSRSANCVGEVLERSEIRRAFDEAPHVSIAPTSTVSMFNGKAHADLLF